MPKNDFFKAKKLRFLENGAPAADPQMDLRYLPYAKACEWAKNTRGDSLKVFGVAFVAKSDKIDATHTGFIVMKPGEAPKLRHASSLRKQVVEQPLLEYLVSRKGKLPGITLFEFLN